jgi:hypothetical protein
MQRWSEACAPQHRLLAHRGHGESRAKVHDRRLDALRREGSIVNPGAAIGSQDDGGTVLASSTVTVASGRGCFTAQCPVAWAVVRPSLTSPCSPARRLRPAPWRPCGPPSCPSRRLGAGARWCAPAPPSGRSAWRAGLPRRGGAELLARLEGQDAGERPVPVHRDGRWGGRGRNVGDEFGLRQEAQRREKLGVPRSREPECENGPSAFVHDVHRRRTRSPPHL